MAGASAAMQEVWRLVLLAARSSASILLRGETGAGKEVVARALHRFSTRRNEPFVAVNCAALPETLLESELFGHEKGAFTGAAAQRQGKFELAHGGTIFLDEIGDISPKLQVDLLRVLQDRAFYRVGGSDEVRVDVRVVAATHVNLQQAVADGRFRDDLFYRLNVIEIRIPPLRERREDIPLLAAHFLERISRELGRDVNEIQDGALRILMDYHWPGNVRELENAVERAVVTCRGRELAAEHFGFLASAAATAQPWNVPAGASLQDMEKVVIVATLERTGGNIKESASVLGIDRSTLYEKIKKYEIPR
jgi:transcriptional regulator with PAS, ATPase and Fis domain